MILNFCLGALALLIVLAAWDERRWRKDFERKREIHRLSFAPRMVQHGHGVMAYEAGASRTPAAQRGAPRETRTIPYEEWSAAGVDAMAYSRAAELGLLGDNPPVLMPPR